MAGNNRRCPEQRVQERRNGRRDLNACQRESEEFQRFSERRLHPAVLGKFDSCKKGALQSPRATVEFAIGLRAFATFASKYSTKDSQYFIITWHMLQTPMFCISMFHVVDVQKAFMSLEKQSRVAAQAHRVYTSTTKMEAEAQSKMLQDVI